MNHPVSESCLERFAFGRSTPAENRSLVSHLLKGCSFCSIATGSVVAEA